MDGLSPSWIWLIVGLVLIMAEALLAPGTYLLWIGLAAAVLGLILAVAPLALIWQLALFGVLALAFGALGWRVYRGRRSGSASDALHDPVAALQGREFALDKPIRGGAGRIRVNDTVWRVVGPDLPAGTRVRVVGSDGGSLRVEPA